MKKQILMSACILSITAGLAACGGKTNSDTEKVVVEKSRANPEPTASELAKGNHYSPATGNTHPTRVFWGDTHLHTNLSQDAFTFGVTLGPEEAYKFAKGQAVKATHGEIAKLDRPLDFLVVADHAEGLGAMQALMDGNETLLKSERLRGWREGILASKSSADLQKVAMDGINNGWPEELGNPAIRGSAWKYLTESADRHNTPGHFTALIGYEWTSWPGGSNLHRVVIFKDDAEKTQQILPFSRDDSPKPEDLWKFLDGYEQKTGGSVLAIPHNGNLSNGLMFPLLAEDGNPLSDDYLKERARWEPVAEVTQIKGDGETHAYLSPNDEFANYETWDFGNFRGVQKTKDMLKHEYARSALKLGLELKADRGVNPYKFGMIGATDSHTGLATADENNFYGKHSGGVEPSPTRWKDPVGKGGETSIPGFLMAASGYAGVWAKENTRESIWDAMKRKEVYATTGPRMTVRLFGGWDFDTAAASSPNLATIGYAKGVPMGGDLDVNGLTADTQAPHFIIAASKDPLGANLDRVQMVKGWRTADGKSHEKIYEVKWAGERTLNAKGKLPTLGSTVNEKDATYVNSIGAAELSTVWSDPDFDKSQHAFYYVRVLEIPTPRWTDYDKAFYKAKLPPMVKLQHQERAYTSPIWYTPK